MPDGHPAAIIAFVATIVVIAVLLVINVFIRESSLWFQASQAEKE